MNHRSMRQFKERFVEVWTSLLTFINKVCLLVSFLLIPYLLGSIIYTLFTGLYISSLILSLVLVAVIYVNKQL